MVGVTPESEVMRSPELLWTGVRRARKLLSSVICKKRKIVEMGFSYSWYNEKQTNEKKNKINFLFFKSFVTCSVIVVSNGEKVDRGGNDVGFCVLYIDFSLF